MKKKFSLVIFLMLLVSVVFMSGCQSNPIVEPGPDTPTSPNEPVNNIPIDDFEKYQQNAIVDNIQILIMESFPMQVSVKVLGNLPDGCTSIVGSSSKMVDDFTFELSIFTERPEEMMCTMALVPFEENINLDVKGLPAGTYTVKGFGLENSFTFDMDNK